MDEILRTSVLVMSLLTAPAPASAQEPKQDSWLGSDKARHVWMSYAVTAFTYAAVRAADQDRDVALSIAVPTGVIVGIGKELYDRSRGERFSTRDLVADAIGIAAAYFLLREVR